MREWIYCAGCETRLQDDEQALPESVITEYATIEYRVNYFCDRICQLQYKMQQKIDALEHQLCRLKDRVTQLDHYDGWED